MCNNFNNNKNIKKLLILLYGIAIIGLFCYVIWDLTQLNEGLPLEAELPILSAITFQLGLLTAWMFNNNNNNKK